MSINKCFISGNLTRDPEMRATQSGTQILSFGVAVNDRRRNPQSGEWEDVPNFIDCVVFGKRADALQRFLTKGMKVAIEGKLRWSQWEKDGQKRSKIEVIVDEVEFLAGQQKAESSPQTNGSTNYPSNGQTPPYSGSQQPAGYPPQGYQQPYQPQQGYPQQPQAPTADVYASEDIPFRKAVAR